MKCHEENSDRKAEAFIRADGEVCHEYDEQVCDDGAIAGFIPISAGQKIVAEGFVHGTTQRVFFDLFVDGVLRNSHSQTNNTARKQRRSTRFNAGFFFEKGSKTLTEGSMLTEELDPEKVRFESPGKDSVGLIEIRISVSRYKDEPAYELEEKNNFEAMTTWDERFPNPGYATLAPTHHVRLPTVEPQSTKNAIGTLRSRINAPRPGPGPWAVMRFYYRGKGQSPICLSDLGLTAPSDMIDEAGYLRAPISKASHALNLLAIPAGSSEDGESDDDGTPAEQMTRASTHEDLKAGNDVSAVVPETSENSCETTSPPRQLRPLSVETGVSNPAIAIDEPSPSLLGSNQSSHESALAVKLREDPIVEAEAAGSNSRENGIVGGITARGRKRANSETPERVSKKVNIEYLTLTINMIRQRKRELQQIREQRMQAEREAENGRVGVQRQIL
jgi:hypothetical protein